MNLPWQFLKNTLTNKFNISGVGLFLMKADTDRWMDGWVRVLHPFNSISIISRRWKDEHERLCAMKRHLGSGRISPPAGFEPATPWYEVGSTNRSATRTVQIQIEDRGLNKDIELVNPLRSWTLKTLNFAPNFEEVVGAYWFWVVRASVCPSVDPFVKLFDACHILWTVHGCMLGLISYMDSLWKMADPYLFSCPSYLPFLNYAPLKKNKNELLSARYLAKYLT